MREDNITTYKYEAHGMKYNSYGYAIQLNIDYILPEESQEKPYYSRVRHIRWEFKNDAEFGDFKFYFKGLDEGILSLIAYDMIREKGMASLGTSGRGEKSKDEIISSDRLFDVAEYFENTRSKN